MDPNVWEEPEQFRPERFLDEFGKVVGKERIMPFSIGTTLCYCVLKYIFSVPCFKEKGDLQIGSNVQVVKVSNIL